VNGQRVWEPHTGNKPRGFTLVELLVSMAIGLLLVVAAAAALQVSSRGYTLVDATAQLRHNASFASGLVSRVASQAGFVDLPYATTPATASELAVAEPAVLGFNNATVSQSASGSIATIRSTNPPVDTLFVKPWSAGSVGAGSDVLVVRYQPVGADAERSRSDGSMVDCSGSAPDTPSTSRQDTAINVFLWPKTSTVNPRCFATRWTTGSTANACASRAAWPWCAAWRACRFCMACRRAHR